MLALIAGILVAFGTTTVWLVAAPFVLLWVLSPLVAHWISLPPPTAGVEPTFAG